MPVNLISKIAPKNNGAFPMVEDIHFEGGFQVRDDLLDRDAIPDLNRKEGMLVYVLSEGLYFQLVGGITNSDWAVADIGSSSLGYKNPARVATTGDIADLTSGAPNVVDGITVVDNDRVLVFNQTDKSENGIYTVSNAGTGSDGTWARSSDANTSLKLIPGSEIYISEGDSNSGCKFWLITPGPISLGTTLLEFVSGVTVMQSDATPTTVFSDTSMPTTETFVTEIDVRNFKEIEWFITVGDKLSAVQIDAKIQFSDLASPGTDDWTYLQTEEISAGVATLSDYLAQKDLADFAAATQFRIGVSSAVRGRTMRLTISSDAATGNATVTAIRRI